MRYSLVFLTFNEIDGLKSIFNMIPTKEFDEIFAVDFRSTDGTREFFKKKGIRIIKQKSKGRGEAYRIAFEKATGDVIIIFSPDGNEDPKDLIKFKKIFNANPDTDIVIATRMISGAHNEEDEKKFKWRKWANNFFNLLANLAFRKRGDYLTDSINGYRAIKKDAWVRMKPDGPGFTIEYQMTMRAFKHNLKILEFPTYESPRIGGDSYAKSLPTGIAFVKIFLKELFRN